MIMSSVFTVSYIVLWITVVFQGLVLLGLVRTLYRLQTDGVDLSTVSRAGNRQGELSPSFTATDVFGNPVTSEEFAGVPTLLLFTSPNCRSCDVALEDIESLKRKAGGHAVIVCSSGTDSQCLQLLELHELDVPVVVDSDSAISKLFSVVTVPTAVLIDEHGLIQSYGNPTHDGERVGERLTVTAKEGERV